MEARGLPGGAATRSVPGWTGVTKTIPITEPAMNITVTVASVLAIAVLIFGNAVFVAAEFSLTALDRSTVEANARGGGDRKSVV